MAVGPAGTRWLKKLPAARILEVDPDTVDKIAVAAGIQFRDLPGMSRQYLREDVERVAAEAVRGPNKNVEDAQ